MIRRGLRILIELQETGGFRLYQNRIEEPYIPSLVRQELEHYKAFCKHHLHYHATTLVRRRHVLIGFLAFLGAQGVTSPSEIQSALLTAFIAQRARHVRPSSLATEGKRLAKYIFPHVCRVFMILPSYLNREGIHHETALIEKRDQSPALA